SECRLWDPKGTSDLGALWERQELSTQFCRLSSLSSIYRNEGLVCCLGSNFAYALALCCLASSAEAAGIQLLGSDPGLSGAIWYPCAGEPKHVALGSLAV